MKTTLLKLPETVNRSDFEQINAIKVFLTRRATGNYSSVQLRANAEGAYVEIYNGTIYTDSALTNPVGNRFNLVVNTVVTLYIVITNEAESSVLTVYGLDKIQWLGNTAYFISGAFAGVIETRIIKYAKTLTKLLVTNDMLSGELTDIPQSVTDLRIETNGVIGNLSDLPPNLVYLRLRQNGVSGNIVQLSNQRKLSTLILGGNNITGDLTSLIGITELRNITLISPNTQITSSLSENAYFPTLSAINLNTITLPKIQTINLFKSFLQTTWTGSKTAAIRTAYTQVEAENDSEFVVLKNQLENNLGLVITLYYS